MMAAPHVPEQPKSSIMTSWRDWFATGDQLISVQNRIVLLQRAPNRSEPSCANGHWVQSCFLDEHEWELQSANMRIQELESMIKRQGSSTLCVSVLSKERPPGLPAVQSCPMRAPVRVTRCFKRPRAIASVCLKTIHWYRALERLHAKDAHRHDAGLPPDGNPSEWSSWSSCSEEDGARKRKTKKTKKGQ